MAFVVLNNILIDLTPESTSSWRPAMFYDNAIFLQIL